MSISDFQKAFQNPFFYGVMSFNGELYEGKHEPIISKRLFDRVQEVMAQKSKPKTPQLKPYLYRGFFRCGECGCFITTETQKGHNYLRCTKRVVPCTQKYVREETIAMQVDRTIERVALEAAVADKMVRQLERDREAMARGQKATILRLKADVTTCEKQTDLLLDLRLNEQISETEYVSKKHALVNRKAELSGELEAFEHNRANRFEPASGLGEMVGQVDAPLLIGGDIFHSNKQSARNLKHNRSGENEGMIFQINPQKSLFFERITSF
jgi:hypothetical protein